MCLGERIGLCMVCMFFVVFWGMKDLLCLFFDVLLFEILIELFELVVKMWVFVVDDDLVFFLMMMEIL